MTDTPTSSRLTSERRTRAAVDTLRSDVRKVRDEDVEIDGTKRLFMRSSDGTRLRVDATNWPSLTLTDDSGNVTALYPVSSYRLTLGAPKTRAHSRPVALGMAQDLSFMKGWAKYAGVTGGAGKPAYWVTRSSDDPNTPGTLRYAITQATAGGGGQILFDPRGEIDVVLASRINVPSNCTIAAPGRNVRIRAYSNVALFNIAGTNVIIRMLELSHLIDTTGINNKLNPGDPGYDAQQGGPADQADAITVQPQTADKIWIDECTIQHVSDGAIDVAASVIHVGDPHECRFSVSRCIVRDQYKSMLCGSSSTDAGDVLYTNARNVFGSYYNNWYDHTAERHPRTAALGYSDSVNNIYDLCSVEADDGVASGTYGIASLYGGWIRTRGDLFRSLDAVATLAVQCSDGTAGIPESAAINENSVAEGALTIQTRNVGTPTALPAVGYDLVPVAVPAAGPDRDAWRRAIQAAAGARVEAMPRGEWFYSAGSAASLNGLTVRAAPEHGGGRYLLDGVQSEAVPQPEALNGASAAVVWTRGATKTIAADVLTIDGSATDWAVNPETGTTDSIQTINGGSANQLAVIRPASAAFTLTLVGGGNIKAPSSGLPVLLGSGDVCILQFDTGLNQWIILSGPERRAAHIADIAAAPTAADFNGLLAALQTAGLMA